MSRVAAVTRNVHAAAASVYDAQTRRWPMPVGVCSPPPFNVYCADPTVLGRMGNIFRCSPNNWEHTLWTSEFAATDPQHQCLVGEGGLVADWLVRYGGCMRLAACVHRPSNCACTSAASGGQGMLGRYAGSFFSPHLAACCPPRRAEELAADAEAMLARANEARPAGSAELVLRKQQLALQAGLFAASHRCVLLEGRVCVGGGGARSCQA